MHSAPPDLRIVPHLIAYTHALSSVFCKSKRCAKAGASAACRHVACHSGCSRQHDLKTMLLELYLMTHPVVASTPVSSDGVPMGFFHCGVLSPVSTASSTMHVPATSSASAGTTCSSELLPAHAPGNIGVL